MPLGGGWCNLSAFDVPAAGADGRMPDDVFCWGRTMNLGRHAKPPQRMRQGLNLRGTQSAQGFVR